MLSIEHELKDYAQRFYISKNGPESPKIERSLDNIIDNLQNEFGDRIISITTFGSYERKTILPREYDRKSDIDLLIVFDHENINVNPSTYRKHLHQFAEQYYPRFISYKSQPSVVLELNHIKYDLVPAYREEGFFSDGTYIPLSDTEWQETDIDGFTNHLNEVNEDNNYNVKRVIRLLKAWNAKVNYPLESYELEQLIADMNFPDDDIESMFFYAIEDLPDDWSTDYTEEKVAALKENAENLYEALEDEDEYDIQKFLRKILPIS